MGAYAAEGRLCCRAGFGGWFLASGACTVSARCSTPIKVGELIISILISIPLPALVATFGAIVMDAVFLIGRCESEA